MTPRRREQEGPRTEEGKAILDDLIANSSASDQAEDCFCTEPPPHSPNCPDSIQPKRCPRETDNG